MVEFNVGWGGVGFGRGQREYGGVDSLELDGVDSLELDGVNVFYAIMTRFCFVLYECYP